MIKLLFLLFHIVYFHGVGLEELSASHNDFTFYWKFLHVPDSLVLFLFLLWTSKQLYYLNLQLSLWRAQLKLQRNWLLLCGTSMKRLKSMFVSSISELPCNNSLRIMENKEQVDDIALTLVLESLLVVFSF